MSRRMALLVVFVTLMASFAPGTALAQSAPPDWSDPGTVSVLVKQLAAAGPRSEEIWAKLGPEARAAVVAYLTPTSYEVVPVPTAPAMIVQATSCQGIQAIIYGNNALGDHLFGYFQQINYCYDGQWITNTPTRIRWGEVYAPYWEFVGHIGSAESGGQNYNYYRGWTQGSFQFCLPGAGCPTRGYPWLDQYVYGDGTHSATGGGV